MPQIYGSSPDAVMAADLANQRMLNANAQQGIDNLMRASEQQRLWKRQAMVDELARQKMQNDLDIARMHYVDAEKNRNIQRQLELEARDRWNAANIQAANERAANALAAQEREGEARRNADWDKSEAQRQVQLLTQLTNSKDPDAIEASIANGILYDPLQVQIAQGNVDRLRREQQEEFDQLQGIADQVNELVRPEREALRAAEAANKLPKGIGVWNTLIPDKWEQANRDKAIIAARENLTTAQENALDRIKGARQLLRPTATGEFEPFLRNPSSSRPTAPGSRREPGAPLERRQSNANGVQGRGVASGPGASPGDRLFSVAKVTYADVPGRGVMAIDESGNPHPLGGPLAGPIRSGTAVIIDGSAIDLTSEEPAMRRAYEEIVVSRPDLDPESAMALAVHRVARQKAYDAKWPLNTESWQFNPAGTDPLAQARQAAWR